MKCTWFLALSLVFVQAAAAQDYTVIDLGPLVPVGINIEGEVAGNVNGAAATWTVAGGIRQLGPPPSGSFSQAVAINDLGAVAGTADGPGTLYPQFDPSYIENCTNLTQPFVWSPLKGFTTPSSFAAAYFLEGVDNCEQETFATGLNLLDQVTATNLDSATYVDAYLWGPSSGMSIMQIDYYQESANAINDLGVVVGQAGFLDIYAGGLSDAVVFKENVPTLLPVPNTLDACSGADSINDLGEIAGWAQTPGSTIQSGCPSYYPDAVPIHAMLWRSSKSAPADLGTLPGDQFSMAVKVNSLGVVVGMSGNSTTEGQEQRYPFLQVEGRPFVWDPVRGMRDLNDLIPASSGWTLQTVSDINVWGQTVGTGTINGETHGFLLTPRVLFRPPWFAGPRAQ
jgi:uncharacterized membrane protein